MNFSTIIEEFIRIILWAVGHFCFWILDIIYDSIKSIAYFNILSSDSNVWNYFSIFISAFLVLFIVIRLAKRYLKTLIDEEESERFRWDWVILRIAAIGFLIIILPFVLKTFGNLLSQLVDKIESVFGVQSNKFSNIILDAMPDTNITINNIDSIKINDKLHGSYKYASSLNDLLSMVISAVFTAFLLLLIGIQIGSRLLSIFLKLIISPYALSSVVDEKNDVFPTWWKLMIADILATYIQMLLLIVGSTFILGIHFNASNGFTSGLAKLIALIGALFGVLNAPSGVSQIIGSDIGVTSALQSMQTTLLGGQMLSMLGNIGSFGAAGLTYGVGRIFGGGSMKSISNAANNGVGLKNIVGQMIPSAPSGFGSGAENIGDSISNGASGIQLQMSDTPHQSPSSISARGGMSGIDGVNSNPLSIGNINPARIISNYAVGGSNPVLRTMARGAAFGGSKLYNMSMNRLQKGVMKHKQPGFNFNNSMLNNMNYYNNNFNNNENMGGNA